MLAAQEGVCCAICGTCLILKASPPAPAPLPAAVPAEQHGGPGLPAGPGGDDAGAGRAGQRLYRHPAHTHRGCALAGGRCARGVMGRQRAAVEVEQWSSAGTACGEPRRLPRPPPPPVHPPSRSSRLQTRRLPTRLPSRMWSASFGTSWPLPPCPWCVLSIVWRWALPPLSGPGWALLGRRTRVLPAVSTGCERVGPRRRRRPAALPGPQRHRLPARLRVRCFARARVRRRLQGCSSHVTGALS